MANDTFESKQISSLIAGNAEKIIRTYGQTASANLKYGKLVEVNLNGKIALCTHPERCVGMLVPESFGNTVDVDLDGAIPINTPVMAIRGDGLEVWGFADDTVAVALGEALMVDPTLFVATVWTGTATVAQSTFTMLALEALAAGVGELKLIKWRFNQ